MPATSRSFSSSRAVAVLVALSASLGGCVAVPLLELAAAPASQATACAPAASGVASPGCNAGGMGSMIPGMANIMQALAPGASPSH
ncbi:MAG TPA: hypothetical protein VK741_08215 [Acetobacteraceae bacterium]|nr:hypothetical protein [Acetobacteraceae bacterium]